MENDKYDILHQRIDIINTQLVRMMDTISQMAKVIQLLQPVTKTVDDLEVIVKETMDELKPITEADLNQDHEVPKLPAL